MTIVARIAEILNVSIDFLTGRSNHRMQAGQLIDYLEKQSKSDPDLKLSDLEFTNIHEKFDKKNYF